MEEEEISVKKSVSFCDCDDCAYCDDCVVCVFLRLFASSASFASSAPTALLTLPESEMIIAEKRHWRFSFIHHQSFSHTHIYAGISTGSSIITSSARSKLMQLGIPSVFKTNPSYPLLSNPSAVKGCLSDLI